MEEHYFNHYGLSKDPFAEVGDDKEYFASPELEHRIELIKHLIEFSDRIIVITGEVGSGKTSLLNHLLYQHDEKWQLCKLSFNTINTTEDFFKQIYLDQGLEFRELDSYASKIHTLHDSFEGLQDKGYIPVLFIDDAHYLSIEILKLLFELAITDQKKPALHIALFSETNIAQLVNHKNLGFIHSLDMPVFSEEQIADYLNHRLTVSGYQGDGIIEKKLVNTIHKASNGLPGLINELASKALQDPAIDKPADNYFETVKSYALNPKYTLPTALLLLTVFIVYILQTEETDQQTLTQSTEIALPNVPELEDKSLIEETTNTETIEDEVILDAVESEITVAVETDAGEQAVEPDIVLLNPEGEIIYRANTEQTSGLTNETHDQEKNKDKNIERNKPIVTTLVADETQPELKKSESEEPPKSDTTSPPDLIDDIELADTIVKTAPLPVSKPESGRSKPSQAKTENTRSVRGGDWLKQQAANNYVLQLMGAHDATAMNKFIQKHSQYTQQLAQFTTTNQNKVWHVLVYGLYSNREKAVAAIATLPPVFRDLNPWPRKIATIQNDLR